MFNGRGQSEFSWEFGRSEVTVKQDENTPSNSLANWGSAAIVSHNVELGVFNPGKNRFAEVSLSDKTHSHLEILKEPA